MYTVPRLATSNAWNPGINVFLPISGGLSMEGKQPTRFLPGYLAALAPAHAAPPPPGHPPLPHPGPPLLFLLIAPRSPALPSSPPPTRPLP